MSAAQSALLMLLTAALLANGAVLLGRSGWQQLGAWLLGFALWSGLSHLLASAGGQAAPMPWELWASSVAWFAVLAFPAIVWRHLYRA